MKFTLEGEFTDLNTFISQQNRSRYHGNSTKQAETNIVADLVTIKRVPPPKSFPVHIAFTWYTPNKRKDADNVCFAKKFILDGLVKAGVLFDDSRKVVGGFSDAFDVDKEKPRVEIVITKLK